MLALDKLYENKVLLFSAGAVALLVAALLILFIFRLAFGRRLQMPGSGRSRQPRLGIVDAFDLDRQRQLVLVRRDNVEHLVMIGGPNDLLIESQIVRVDTRAREKETTVPPLTTASPLAWTAAPAVGEAKPDFVNAARDDVHGGSAPSINPAISPALPPLASPPSYSSAPAFSASPPLLSGAPGVSSAPAVSSIPVPSSSQNAPAPLVASSEGTPLSPPAPAAPKRPSFLPPRRPLATPTFGTKPLSPEQSTLAGDGLHESPLQDSLNPAPVAPPPLPGVTVPPPSKPLGPTPSFLRPRPPTPSLRPSIPAPVAPALPVSSAPVPEIEPQVKADKGAEGLELKPDALDTLEEEMAKLLGRNLDKP